MSNEKRLGLVFLGILVVAFCGVLTMRLMDNRQVEDKVEINVGGSATAKAPAASPSGSSAAAKSSGGGPAASPPPSTGFQGADAARAPGNGLTAARAPATPPAYLPPPSNMRPVGDSATASPYAASSARAVGASNDPFSRGPASSAVPPAGLAASAPSSAAAPPGASSPNPYRAVPADGAGAPAASMSAPPPPFASTASHSTLPPATPEPPAAPLTAGNPLRGPAVTPETRSPVVASLAGPNEPPGTALGAPAGFRSPPPPAEGEPTLPTGNSTANTPTGRVEAGATFSPSGPPAGRFVPAGGAQPINGGPGTTIPSGLTAAGGNNPSPQAGNIAVTSAAIPTATPPAAPTQDKPYVVAADDSFWSISEKAYGDGSYYRALFQYNRDRFANADSIRPGSVLDIPPLEVLKRQFPDLIGPAGAPPPDQVSNAGATTYVVREGDTLFEIARKQLGKASRWTEIYELNRGVLGENLENLRPGVELRLR